MKTLYVLLLGGSVVLGSSIGRAATRAEVGSVAVPDVAGGNRHYVGNRPPLNPSPLIPLPLGGVRPEGWTRKVLQLQNDGFHGHLPQLSKFLKREDNAWLSREGRGRNGWEEEPYWLKGFQDCAFLVGDQARLSEARVWIEGAIASQQADGWFGPGEGRSGVATDLKGREDLWPNMIMLFCLQSYHEQTGDDRVTELMRRYFRYLNALPEDKFLVGYWPKMRAGDLLWSVLWLYNRTGEQDLIALAHKVHRSSARWDQDLINLHNVNIAQGFREPAEYFVVTKDPSHLEATERVWQKVRRLYGQVPGGMYGGDENCRDGHEGPRQAIETCGIAEEMLSNEILLAITGNPTWADRCENVAFNSLPAAFTADMKALRYLTAPNQPQSDHAGKAPGIENDGPMYCMNPHDHRCCQHNAGHAWPLFVKHLWYAAPGDGLAAVLYSPCRVTAKVGDGTEITIQESTHYPFDETVNLRLSTPRPVAFPLYLRIPGWCKQPRLMVNGRLLGEIADGPGFARIERVWKDGDQVELRLPMGIRVRRWEENRGFASVHRGPLTYSLLIQERAVRHGGTDAWPAWDLFPDSPWNYGLVLPRSIGARTFALERSSWPSDDQPWVANQSPLAIKATGRRIPAWTLDERGLVNEVQQSPIRSNEKAEEITLIPMGAARLRISAFPVIGAGAGARDWVGTSPKESPSGNR
ncbi:MAG: glycoside hydrolase family 127 protein [Verrucomicrobiales bacterium]|nr:glycoside hydrolase family 127 protein [Verrucomicrobiales bacterium]